MPNKAAICWPAWDRMTATTKAYTRLVKALINRNEKNDRTKRTRKRKIRNRPAPLTTIGKAVIWSMEMRENRYSMEQSGLCACSSSISSNLVYFGNTSLVETYHKVGNIWTKNMTRIKVPNARTNALCKRNLRSAITVLKAEKATTMPATI